LREKRAPQQKIKGKLLQPRDLSLINSAPAEVQLHACNTYDTIEADSKGMLGTGIRRRINSSASGTSRRQPTGRGHTTEGGSVADGARDTTQDSNPLRTGKTMGVSHRDLQLLGQKEPGLPFSVRITVLVEGRGSWTPRGGRQAGTEEHPLVHAETGSVLVVASLWEIIAGTLALLWKRGQESTGTVREGCGTVGWDANPTALSRGRSGRQGLAYLGEIQCTVLAQRRKRVYNPNGTASRRGLRTVTRSRATKKSVGVRWSTKRLGSHVSCQLRAGKFDEKSLGAAFKILVPSVGAGERGMR